MTSAGHNPLDGRPAIEYPPIAQDNHREQRWQGALSEGIIIEPQAPEWSDALAVAEDVGRRARRPWTVVHHGETVAMDLSESTEELWRQTRSKTA